MRFQSLISLALLGATSVLAGDFALHQNHQHDRRAVSTNKLYGYATLNGGTTGGAGGSSVTVKTLADLRAAVKGSARKTIYVDGIITGDKKPVDIGSNTSVLGKGSKSGLTNGGLRVTGEKNVIIRNLKLSKSPGPTDLVSIEEGSTNVWVDHCDFESSLAVDKDYYDGQLDIKHASDFITVSWNRFHDSWKTSLIGHSEKNGAEDKGHLRVTYHHNVFENVNSRLPSMRFGTLHAYNNYYNNIKGSGINLRNGAQGLVESNRFKNTANPIETILYGGYVVSKDNDFTGSDEPDLSGKGSLTKMPYSYDVDATSAVSQITPAGAGVGKISD